MAANPTTDINMEFEDLSETAMDIFCQDMAGMFDVAMNCQQQKGCMETARGLKKQYKNIAAIISAQAKGHLKGTFHLIFDREGLFTLAGIIVMQPKLKIVENRTKGALAEAEDVRDAMKEGGNLLIGSWNRICLRKWGNDNHLLQVNTFIGNPWNNTRESLNIAESEEFLYIPCDMTVGEYPAFKCGVLFPKEIRDSLSGTASGQADTVQEEKPQESKPVAEEKPASVEKKMTPVEVKPAAVENIPIPAEKKPEEVKTKVAQALEKLVEVKEKPASVPEAKVETKPEDKKLPADSASVTESKADVKAVQETVAQATESSKESATPSITVQFTAKDMDLLWKICAKDIMRKNIIWCESDESVEQVRIKMDQNDINYVLVGTAGVMEGILSRSDLRAIMSPYLRPVFAQWRRPLDEASLQIKVKWAMTRPVHIVRPEKPLAVVMENMSRFGVRALPVVDQQGKVEGLITVFDIFQSLLQKNDNHVIISKTA